MESSSRDAGGAPGTEVHWGSEETEGGVDSKSTGVEDGSCEVSSTPDLSFMERISSH